MKSCKKCHKNLPLSAFRSRIYGVDKNKQTYTGKCKECLNLQQREYYEANPTKQREKEIKNRYGISYEEYLSLFNKQNGCCQICLQPFALEKLRIDHCHTQGRVRALLCHGCNCSLGYIKENIEYAKGLVEYIRLFCQKLP